MRNATLYPYFLKKSQWGRGGKKGGGGGLFEGDACLE